MEGFRKGKVRPGNTEGIGPRARIRRPRIRAIKQPSIADGVIVAHDIKKTEDGFHRTFTKDTLSVSQSVISPRFMYFA